MLSGDAPIARLAQRQLGSAARPVRAILLDKSLASNWGVGWHQDRTIAVKRRIAVDGFGPWSVKRGVQHVAPPFTVLSAMITLRVHLDDVPEENAPLIVALGTHRLGRVAEPQLIAIAEQHRHLSCLARPGDVWMYATPILHKSQPAREVGRRRVLQVDCCAMPLPGGLAWVGL